jgi:hypothetical protein
MASDLSFIKETLKRSGYSEKAIKEILAWYTTPKKKIEKPGRQIRKA